MGGLLTNLVHTPPLTLTMRHHLICGTYSCPDKSIFVLWENKLKNPNNNARKKTPKNTKKMPTKRDVSIIAEESSLSLVSGQLCLSTNAFAKAGSGKVTRGDAE